MAKLRISGNWRNPNKMEFGGILKVDKEGHIERSLEIPEDVYEKIEVAIGTGNLEGRILQEGDVRYDWFLDR